MISLETEIKMLCDDDSLDPEFPTFPDERDLEDLSDPNMDPGPWGWDDDPA